MIFWLNLEKVVFKLMQNLASKLQFNGFLFCGKVVSSWSWWRSHQCLYSVLWMFYLFSVFNPFILRASHTFLLHMFGIMAIVLEWFQLNCPWQSLVYSAGPDKPSYHLSCVADVQLIRQYIFHCMNNPTAMLQDDYYIVALFCFHLGCFLSSCQT